MQRVLGKIEKLTKSKIPNHLKKILKFTGFDTEFALVNINEKSIKEIEEFVNAEKTLLARLLVKTKYENICVTLGAKFQFDIGDRTALLGIPDIINKSKKETDKETKNKAKNINENFDEKNIKTELSEKINKLLKDKKIKYSLEQKNIKTCEILNGNIQCKVQCASCNSVYSCFKKTHWRFSNFIKHVVSHQGSKETTTALATASSTDYSSNTVRAVNSNESALSRILSGKINSKFKK